MSLRYPISCILQISYAFVCGLTVFYLPRTSHLRLRQLRASTLAQQYLEHGLWYPSGQVQALGL